MKLISFGEIKGRELEVDKVADGVGVRIRTFQKRGSSRNSIP